MAIRSLYIAILLTLSTYLAIYTLGHSNMLKNYPNTAIVSMVEQTSPRPFVYRMLVPLLTQSVISITPDTIVDTAGNYFIELAQTPFAVGLIEHAKWSGFDTDVITVPANAFSIGIVFFLQIISLVVYGLALKKLTAHFFPSCQWMPYLTSLFGVWLLIGFVKNVSKIYDFPLLALFALALLFLYQQRWVAYGIVLALATINKETSFLLIGFFAIIYWAQLKSPPHRQLLFIQCALYVGITGLIRYFFSDLRGEEYWNLTIPTIWLHFRDMSAVHAMLIIMMFWLITARWQELPVQLRKSVWIFAACAVFYYVFGRFREYRIFYECFPGLSVIAGYTLFRPLDAPPER